MTALRVVIAGGGVAALEAAYALRARAGDRVAVTLVSPSRAFRWRALEVGEPFGLGHPVTYDVEELCEDAGAGFRHDAVSEVRGDAREVVLASGETLAFDALVLAVGARPCSAYDAGVTFDRGSEAERFAELMDDLSDRLASSVTFVVPPDVRWSLPAYELALLTVAHEPGLRVTLVTAEPRALALFGTVVSTEVERVMEAAGVRLITGVAAQVVSDAAVRAGDRWVTADRVVALPSLSGPRLRGIPSDDAGFVCVGPDGRVAGLGAPVFAIGDGAACPVKQGGLAAAQADAAAAQIAALVGVEPIAAPVPPLLRALMRTADGPLYLEADPTDPEGTSRVSRRALWWPPAKVAAPWLTARLAELDALRLTTPA